MPITLTYAGQTKTLAEWGFASESLRHVRRNLDVGTYEGFIPMPSIGSPALFAFEQPVAVRRGNLPAFVGKVTAIRPTHDGRRAGHHYTFSNAWYDLEHTQYKQLVASHPNGPQTLQFPRVSGLMLFREVTTTGLIQSLTTGQQIERILQFVLDENAAQGLPLLYQIGTIEPDLSLPPFEAQEMSCADAIRKCLELHPDCVLDFDYSTTPAPTVHVRRRSSLSPLALFAATSPNTNVKEFGIRPRYDLQPRAVVIFFRQHITVNGVTRIHYLKDKFGPNGQNSPADPDNGLRVITQTFDVAGSRFNSIQSALDCEPVPADADPNYVGGSPAVRKEWWTSLRGGGQTWVRDMGGKIRNLAISLAPIKVHGGNPDPDISDVSLADFPNRLVQGVVQDWMGLDTVDVSISARVTWEEWNAETGGSKVADQEDTWNAQITLTNGESRSYSTVTENTPGESIPGLVGWDANGQAVFDNGIAKRLYRALAELQYEADHITVADTCPGKAHLLRAFNFRIGVAPEPWSDIRALAQEIIEHDGDGTTSVRIAPGGYYTAGQMHDLWRFNSWRNVFASPTERATANAGAGQTLWHL